MATPTASAARRMAKKRARNPEAMRLQQPTFRQRVKPSRKNYHGRVKAILARGLTQQACGKYGYSIGEYKGEPVHIATYHDKDGKAVAQKLGGSRTSVSRSSVTPRP